MVKRDALTSKPIIRGGEKHSGKWYSALSWEALVLARSVGARGEQSRKMALRLLGRKKNPAGGRPPAAWMVRMRPRIRKQYPSLKEIRKRLPGGECGKERTHEAAVDCIIAGIWWGMDGEAQNRIAGKYEGGKMKKNPGKKNPGQSIARLQLPLEPGRIEITAAAKPVLRYNPKRKKGKRGNPGPDPSSAYYKDNSGQFSDNQTNSPAGEEGLYRGGVLMNPANPICPGCNGNINPKTNPGTYKCGRCGHGIQI